MIQSPSNTSRLHRFAVKARMLNILFVVMLSLSALAAVPPDGHVQAATLVVTSTANDGAGSLRQVINNAGANDIITFNLTYPAVIQLTSQITVDKNLTIVGPGQDQLAISGNNLSRIFLISEGTLRLSQITLQNGRVNGSNASNNSPGSTSGTGGALFVASSAGLTAENVTIKDNVAVGGNGADSGYVDGIGYFGGAGGGKGGAPGGNGNYGGGGGGGWAGNAAGAGGTGGGGGGNSAGSGSAPGGAYGGQGGSGSGDAVGYGGGGGGAAMGGALFIANGGAAGLRSVTFTGNQVIGGNGGNAASIFGGGGGGGGAALGSAIYNFGELCVETGVTFSNNTKTGGLPGTGKCGFGGGCPSAATAGQAYDHTNGIFDATNSHSCSVWYYEPTDLTFTAVSLQENQPIGTQAGSFTTTDPDVGDTFTYSLVSGTGGTDNAAFAVSGSQLVTAAVLDYEVKSNYSVRVRTTDKGGRYLEKVFTVAILGVNDPPSEIELSASGIAENMPSGTRIGDFTVVDQDNPPHVLSLVSGGAGCPGTDNGDFVIEGNQLSSAAVFNYEERSSFEICVRAIDSGDPGLKLDRVVEIQVTDVNEMPHALSLSTPQVNEQESIDTLIGRFSTQDVDTGQSHTYSLVEAGVDCNSADNGVFSIVDDELRTAQVFEYETKASYQICVRTTDDGSPALSIDRPFTIAVQDINEAPTDLTLSNNSLLENLPPGSLVGNFTTVDQDTAQSHTYALVEFGLSCPGTDNNAFTIEGDQLKSAQSFDYDTQASYEICVRTTDDGNPALSFTEPFTVQVAGENEAPTGIDLSATTLAENLPTGTILGKLTTSDQDYPPHSYSLVNGGATCGGADNAAFVIEGDQIKSALSFDYEAKNSYAICVRTTDSGDPQLSLDRLFTITITDANDVPVSIALSATYIQENLPIHSLVGSLTVTDPDTAQSHEFTLVDLEPECAGTDNDDFTIDGDQLLSGSVFDNEVQASYQVCVQATDNGSPSLSLAVPFTIEISDVNEAPHALALSASEVPENEPVGSVVGTFTAVDVDLSQSHTYSLVSTGSGCSSVDNGAFTISGNELKTALSFNHEMQDLYEICVRTTDSGVPALSLNQPFSIQVTDVNEAPVVINTLPDQGSIAGELYLYTVPGDTFEDPDEDVLVFTATLADGSPLPPWLGFDPTTRTFNGLPVKMQVLTLSVTAQDAGEEQASTQFILTISGQDGNQPPIVMRSIPNFASPGTPFTFAFSPDTFADIDGDTLSFLAELDGGLPLPGWLSFDPVTRTFSGAPPAGESITWTIQVTALDRRGGEVTTRFQLAVGQNVPPSLVNPIANQSAATGLPWTFQIPKDAFADPNGDVLRFSASLADGSPLPGWLGFDPVTLTFTGTPPGNPAPLVYDLRVTAEDDGPGGSASGEFQLSPWSAERNSSLPSGSLVRLANLPGAGPATPPAGVTRLFLTVDIRITYAGQTLSDISGVEVPVCFQVGPAERLQAKGDLSRLVIGSSHGQGPWELLPTHAISTQQICATADHFSSFDMFLLPELPQKEMPVSLPATGFSPGQVSTLPAQPSELAYTVLGDVWLEVPGLDLQTTITGVPLQDGEWDVSWLGNRAGWLEGSAFPGLDGNSYITAHVYGADGKPGPFVNLRNLVWGQPVIVHAFGQAYTFDIRSVTEKVSAHDLRLLRHENLPWITLITCQGYHPESDSYRWRTVARAVLVKVEDD